MYPEQTPESAAPESAAPESAAPAPSSASDAREAMRGALATVHGSGWDATQAIRSAGAAAGFIGANETIEAFNARREEEDRAEAELAAGSTGAAPTPVGEAGPAWS